jgi:hypothetical protein
MFRTTYVEKGYDEPVPQNLWIEITGNGPDISQAVAVFMGWAAEVSSVLAICTNAAMGQLETELVFDINPENDQHEFLQVFVPEWPLSPVPGRRIDTEIIQVILTALVSHDDLPRISRAIAQYSEALNFWRHGREVSCVAHLYMAVEALTPAILRQHMKKLGKTKDQLASDWQVEIQRVNNEARLRLIFDGDADCFNQARNASDAFEHGFLDFDAVRKIAQEISIRTAGYVRRGIFRTLELQADIVDRLFDGNYSFPRGPLLLVRYLKGQMIGKIDELAAEPQQYPILDIRPSLKTVRIGEDGNYGFWEELSITPKIGEKAQFKPERYEIWDGSTIRDAYAADCPRLSNPHSSIAPRRSTHGPRFPPSRLFGRLPPCSPSRRRLAGIRKPLTIPDLQGARSYR